MKTSVFISASLMLGLAACAVSPTPFQPADSGGLNGYTVTQIEANRYRLSFNGNTETPRQSVDTNLIYLAAQVTLKNGGEWFELTYSEAQKSTSFPTYPDPEFGNFGWWSPHYPYYASATSVDFSHPDSSWDLTAEILVRHGTKRADKTHAYDAQDVVSHVGPSVSRTDARFGPY